MKADAENRLDLPVDETHVGGEVCNGRGLARPLIRLPNYMNALETIFELRIGSRPLAMQVRVPVCIWERRSPSGRSRGFEAW